MICLYHLCYLDAFNQTNRIGVLAQCLNQMTTMRTKILMCIMYVLSTDMKVC